MSAFFALLLSVLAIFLILLVLVQRGRGGGLAGALGGMGGSSAFGAKAGDVFTRITIVTASIWIVISIIVFFWAEHRGDAFGTGEVAAPLAPADNALDAMSQPPAGEAGPPAVTAPAGSGADSSSPARPAAGSTAPPASNSAAPPATDSESPPPANNE
jgi:preprotein translocase subunit SecG